MERHVAGHSVWVADQGQGETRLFIHSALGRHNGLIPLAQAMPPARNLFFDLPGHGRSAPLTEGDFPTGCLNIAAGLLDGPAHVMGHSFGATVALRLAIDHPDLVSRVTLIEPVMFAAVQGTPAGRDHDAVMADFVAAWTAGDKVAAAAAFLAIWGDGTPWDNLPPRIRALLASQIHLIPQTAPAIQDDVHGVLDRLDTLTCPVDLIEGSDSQPVIPAILSVLADAIPQATRCVIDGAGHMVPLTHPDQLADLIRG